MRGTRVSLRGPRRAVAAVLGALVLVSGCRHQSVAHLLPLAHPASGAPSTPLVQGYTAWPMVAHDARLSSSSTVQGPVRGAVRWRRVLEGPATSGPLTGADGTLYLTTTAGVLHAMDPRTGKDRWRLVSPGHAVDNGLGGPALLPDGTLLWPAPGHRLYAVAGSGRPRWQLRLPATVGSPTVVTAVDFYVPDSSGRLSAFRLVHGRPVLRWQGRLGAAIRGPVAVATDGSLRLAVDGEVLAVVDAGDRATVAWKARLAGATADSVALGLDGVTVVTTSLGHVLALDVAGRQLWDLDLRAVRPAALSSRGLAYVGDRQGAVHLVLTADGSRSRDLGPSGPDGAAVTDLVVDGAGDSFAATASGHVLAWTGSGRALFDVQLARAALEWASLTGDGSLAVVSSDGRVTVLRGAVA